MEMPYLILAAILLSLVLAQVNQRVPSPLLAIADRWLRWLVFAFGGAQISQDFAWIDRPYWVLVVVFFRLTSTLSLLLLVESPSYLGFSRHRSMRPVRLLVQ